MKKQIIVKCQEFLSKQIHHSKIVQKSHQEINIVKKRKIRKKKYNNFIKDNTYDNILLKKRNSPVLNKGEKYDYNNKKEKPKSPIITLNSKINSQQIFQNNKTEQNKLYKNYTFYYSKFSKKEKNEVKKKEEKKDIEKISEDKSISSASFSRRKTKKKLTPEEKLELLRQINKESRDKSKKRKSALKSEDESKSVSYTTKKNDISNDISFSEIASIDNEKKSKEEKDSKLNVNKLKSEIKKEIKNEVKEELKAELGNKIILELLNNNNDKNNSNDNIQTKKDYSTDQILNNINNQNIDYKNNENYTNRSINSIDIFFPPNKNISSAGENEVIPGLININTHLINEQPKLNNKINKENAIIKKFVKLNNLKSIRKVNKTPTALRNNNNYYNNSPNIRKKNFSYHKIPISNNNNIYCRQIQKKNELFDLRHNTLKLKKININNFNNTNILNNIFNSPMKVRENSPIFIKKIIVKNNNNNDSLNGKKTKIDNIIKIPKKFINNVNYIDNNSIIINNKTNNIVYIKQNSPRKVKKYEINGIYEKKINYIK